MLQLNSYRNKRLLRWFKMHMRREAVPFLFLIKKRTPEKKKFVITQRVKRLYATLWILYGIECVLALLFVQRGLSLNGWLIFAGVLLLLSELKIAYVFLANSINKPVEALITRYYIQDAKKILKSHPDLIVIGITGSYGKTSTKYILNKILSQKYHVLMTPESYNTTLGVVRTIREQLKSVHQVFIVEMGAKEPGDIQEICNLVNPRYGILTSIGPQHLETFKTQENIIKTKFELPRSVQIGGKSFLNMENAFIREEPFEKTAIRYAAHFDKKQGLDYWAKEIVYDEQGLSFQFCTKNGESFLLKTKLLGGHNVLNVVAASSVAYELGVLQENIQYAVKRLEPVPHRLELLRRSGQSLWIDDAYNSNPEGASEAIRVLGKFQNYEKVLVTPGLVELGEKEYEYNYSLGVEASKVADYIILVGGERTKPLFEGVHSTGYSNERLFVTKTLQEGLAQLEMLKKDKKVVLLLNDLPDNF